MVSGRPTSVVGALQIIASLSSAVSAMRLKTLERRVAHTNAVCVSEYAWADTQSTKKPPCQVAAEVLAPCNGGIWAVPALLASDQRYANPGPGIDNAVANPCSCSWAAYNLLSACSDCQGIPQAVRIWHDYTKLCPAVFLGNGTYYPQNYLPNDVRIPYWAITDPTKWVGGQYSALQAKTFAQLEKADVGTPTPPQATPPPQTTPPPQAKKSLVGPIVGTVIGGLVALGIVACVAYFLIRRDRLNAKNAAVDNNAGGNNTRRNPSDTTITSQTSMGDTNFSSRPSPGTPAYAPTVRIPRNIPIIRIRARNIQGFSIFGSPNHNTVYSGSPSHNIVYPTSPPPPLTQTIPNNPEDVVIPFTLRHHRNDPTLSSTVRKSRNGVTFYDPPNGPPARVGDLLPETPERPRINPPAHDSIPSGTSRPRAQHTNDSSDADLSYSSTNTNNPELGRGDPGDHSGSSIFTSPNDGASLTGAGSTYTSPSSYPRGVKRRPTEDRII